MSRTTHAGLATVAFLTSTCHRQTGGRCGWVAGEGVGRRGEEKESGQRGRHMITVMTTT